MSSGGRGEEPINLGPHMRAHYAQLLRSHGCSPRCRDCRHAQGALIAGGASITPERTRPDERAA